MTAAVDPAGDAADFVVKWRGAWPEWALVQGFVPAPMRARAEAWQALQFEWQEAAWRGDARPGELKLLWWVEELQGWSQGRRRHPLGSVLHREPVPWSALAQVLPSLAAARARPRDPADAWRQLDAIAVEAARVEGALLGGASDPVAVAAGWLHARLARHPDDAVPALLPSTAAWGDALLAGWPRRRGLVAPRAIESGLARARLARGDASRPLPPLAALWAGWRSARG